MSVDSRNYVELAIRTESDDYDGIATRCSTTEVIRLQHAGNGLASEAGEFLDALKKHVYYDAELDRVNLTEELGDMMWYVALAADTLGVDLEELLYRNIAKLATRYPEKFTKEDASDRNLGAERKILEGDGPSAV